MSSPVPVPVAKEGALEGLVGRLMTQGGDERIELDPRTGLNRYGCGPRPAPGELAFGSSTASTISSGAFAAARAAAERLALYVDPREAYAVGAEIVRQRLAAACGLPAEAASRIVLAPSGTDLHLIAADLARGDRRAPLTVILPDPCETGRGVPAAVASRRFSTASPFGAPARGAAAAAGLLPGARPGEVLPVALRRPDGAPRPAVDIDDDVHNAVLKAAKQGGPLLLILADVSKTGLVAPTPACAAELKARLGGALTVLVDACQFRLSAEQIGAYLAQDFLVAVTGSKFVGGPAFSGALLIPASFAARARLHSPLKALGDYSSRHDWPAGYGGRAQLPDLANHGLMLRWEAALFELEAFRSCPPEAVRRFLESFSAAVGAGLQASGHLRALPTPEPSREDPGDWSAVRTIFPFVAVRGGEPVGAAATERVYRRLMAPGAARPVRLGQPVNVGAHGREALTALRLSLSARQVSFALSAPERREAVIAEALEALARTAAAVAAG